MIPDWETNVVYFSEILCARHPGLWQRLTDILREHHVAIRILHDTSDIWARDYCPVQLRQRMLLQLRYNPDYLRGYESLITVRRALHDQVVKLGRVRNSPIVFDGGNVVAAKHRIIVTDKIFPENPIVPQKSLLTQLKLLFRVDQIIVIPREPYDVIGHVDGVVRFLDESIVVVNDYSKTFPSYAKRLVSILKKHGLRVMQLPYFTEGKSYDGIPSAVGSYVNFLRVSDLVILPAFGKDQDRVARTFLKRLCPRLKIVSVPSRALGREGGLLNCIAWTVRA